MPQPRKPNVGSIQSVAKNLAARKDPPKPPFELTEREKVIWQIIVEARAPTEWVGIDAYLAGHLCQHLIALEDEWDLLQQEGSVLAGPKGGSILNPRATNIASLRMAVFKYQTRLRLAVMEISDDALNAGRRQNRVMEAMDDALDDDDTADLIPRLGPAAVQPSARTPPASGYRP